MSRDKLALRRISHYLKHNDSDISKEVFRIIDSKVFKYSELSISAQKKARRENLNRYQIKYPEKLFNDVYLDYFCKDNQNSIFYNLKGELICRN